MFEGAPKNYRDPFWSGLASMAEQDVGLPNGLLRSILTKGERSNADQVSSAGARTPFQVIPETRQALIKKYGVDAYESPESAAKAAALVLKEGLDRNKGDVRQAVGEYIGGVNRKNWGPVTQSYIDRVAGQGGQGGKMNEVDELMRLYEERLGGSNAQKKTSPGSEVDELMRLYEEKTNANASQGTRQEARQAGLLKEQKKGKPSFGEAVFQGAIQDPLDAGAQLLEKALPKSVGNKINEFNNFLAEKTGLVAPVGPGGVNEMVQAGQKEYAQRQGQGFDIGRTVGAVVSPTNIALAGAVPAKMAATGLGRVAASAGLGAASGALQPISEGDYADQLKKNIALGLVSGGALAGAGEGLAKVLSPIASRNPDIQALKEMGISPTVGQASGGYGQKIEDLAQSVPILGGRIDARKAENLQKFQNAMFNKAGGPIGFKTDKFGFDGIKQLDDAVNEAYTKAVGKTKTVRVDDSFLSSASKLSSMASEVPDNGATKKALDTQIDLMLSKVSKADKILPDTWKEFDAKLGNIARKTGNQDYKNAIRELQKEWRGMAARSNPEQADLFKNVDKAFRGMTILEKATESAAKQDGLFTPNQLYRAARTSAGSKSSSRQKTAPFMKEALAAERVLGSKTPNSGTAERLMAGGIFGGAGVAVDPTFLAAPALGGLMYSKPIAPLVSGAITNRPKLAQPVAEYIQSVTPFMGLFGPQIME
jgi:hypothetical protein